MDNEGGLGSYLLPGGMNNDNNMDDQSNQNNHQNSLSQLQDDADMVSA